VGVDDVVATTIELVGDRVLHLGIWHGQGVRTRRIAVNRQSLRTRSDSSNQDPVLDRKPGAGNRQRSGQYVNVVPARGKGEGEIPDVPLLSADIGWIELREHQNSHFATSR
jgi:hypothetical protein